MPEIYGTVDAFKNIRSAVKAALDALVAAMASGSVDPALVAAYDDHWGTVALTFPCVSVGFEESGGKYVGPSTGTHQSDFNVRTNLRVMLGNANAFRDEKKLYKLQQSIINYFEERRVLATSPQKIVTSQAFECRPLRAFDDTRTIGGELVFWCRASNQYTNA